MNAVIKGSCAVAILLLGACAPSTSTLAERQETVAEIGSEVMPFDLERTMHTFEKLDDGGRQVVVSEDVDEGQVALIRDHLADEAERFARGDFHHPKMIHGEDMPGMHALVMGADRISIRYFEVDGGAEILYTSEDRALVDAIHEWFDAQLADHGAHARPGG